MAYWPARGGAGVSATPRLAFGPSSRSMVVRRHPVARQASVAGRDSFNRGRARSPPRNGRGPCCVHLPRDGIVHPDGLKTTSTCEVPGVTRDTGALLHVANGLQNHNKLIT